ncbi:winged helix-turn-helix transcriptional regulator [Nitrososphaera sp.]|uniref:winged helix-turn-helix transcriptional regulator n=1 Tax=Nitrososphaera sp. TaxID=1971748 RepID=UPI003D6FDFCE
MDKKILTVLLNPEGQMSSHDLAEKLNLPRTTIQRRRRSLEKRFLTVAYSLNLEELGYRRVDLLIFAHSGKTMSVGKRLLEFDPVVYVARAIGEHTIDLKAEIIIKDNLELLELLEKIKSMDGVRDAIWSESIEVIGRKRSIPLEIISKM